MVMIDFNRIRNSVTLQDVLHHYGIELSREGTEWTALCPFHAERTPSFKVNFQKGPGGLFYCHGCGVGGDALAFVAKYEGNIPLRAAAGKLAEWFSVHEHGSPRNVTPRSRHEPIEGKRQFHPLRFVMPLQPRHSYLQSRGIDVALARKLGLGVSSRGLMASRICFPLWFPRGEASILVGYAGRWPGDPPGGRPRWMMSRSFPKARYLYGIAELPPGTDEVCIVEGIFSVIRLREQLEIPAVALLGTSLSSLQIALLEVRGIRRVTLLLDGDEAGRRATDRLMPRLARHIFVRAVHLPRNAEPDTIAEAELRRLLETFAS